MTYAERERQRQIDDLIAQGNNAEAAEILGDQMPKRKANGVLIAFASMGMICAAYLAGYVFFKGGEKLYSWFLNKPAEFIKSEFIESQVEPMFAEAKDGAAAHNDMAQFEEDLEARTDSLLGTLKIGEYTILERKVNGGDVITYFEKSGKILFDSKTNDGKRLVIVGTYKNNLPDAIGLRYQDAEGNISERTFLGKPSNSSKAATAAYMKNVLEFLELQQKELDLEPSIWSNGIGDEFEAYIDGVEQRFRQYLGSGTAYSKGSSSEDPMARILFSGQIENFQR